jgi:hypothetical protein
MDAAREQELLRLQAHKDSLHERLVGLTSAVDESIEHLSRLTRELHEVTDALHELDDRLRAGEIQSLAS